MSELYASLPATKPYPGKEQVRSEVAKKLAQQNVDFADALLAGLARRFGEPLYSFDKDFDRLGTRRVEP
ncbi:MAG: PIN domain-containing protein [Bacillota bacterium]|nr:PIN domain-containing protein [Bacillota bacterium]